MKKLAIILAVITVFALAVAGWYFYSLKLNCTFTVTVSPASKMDDMFLEVKADIAAGKYEGISSLRGEEEYFFVTLNADAHSICPFPAEWVTFSANQISGDAITIAEKAGPCDIPAFGESTFSITLLSASDTLYRGAILNYYILGQNHSVYLDYAPEEVIDDNTESDT